MLSIDDAQRLVLSVARPLAPIPLPLRKVLGLTLAEDVVSDLDMPPYDKALVDGFAVRSLDLPAGKGELAIVGEVFAGRTPDRPLAAGQAIRIMTGAPIPPGTDAVVMVERTSRQSAVGSQQSAVSSPTHHSPLTTHSVVLIDDPRLKPGQNIMRRGTEMTRDQLVLRAGTRLRPPEIGLLAAVGRALVSVYARPQVAIVSTGDEIVEANELPGPGQIRNSNGPTLIALSARAGGEPQYLGVARDTSDDLRCRVQQALAGADILILSGGVSAGELDLVPGVLQELGVRQLFHKVNLKPGKPVWFGNAERETRNAEAPSVACPESAKGVVDQSGCVDTPFADSGRATRAPSALPADPQSAIRNPQSLVFGLPGNPVSVMVCFELFVRPAIRKLMGSVDPLPRLVWARLTEDKTYRSDRPTYWPAWLEDAEDGYRVRPLTWHGSPDLRATTDSNAFVFFPVGEHSFRKGDRLQVLRCD